MVEAGEVELASSSVLEYENSCNPFPTRAQWVERCLELVSVYRQREGLKALDALHVACAEATASEYFLTCGDHIVRRYQGGIKVLNPVELALSAGGDRYGNSSDE